MKQITKSRSTPLAGALGAAGLLLGACTVMPTGPSLMAMPGSTKTVDQFYADSVACQARANAVIAAQGAPTAAYADNQAANVAAGSTVYGAATGALIGAAGGYGAEGAAIGAVMGLLFGSMAGSSYTYASSYQLQRGYDGAYHDCMYASGHKVPRPAGYAYAPARPDYRRYAPPPGYAPPANVPPSSYPPPDAPPPAR